MTAEDDEVSKESFKKSFKDELELLLNEDDDIRDAVKNIVSSGIITITENLESLRQTMLDGFSATNTLIKTIDEKTNKRFNDVDNRFNDVDNRFDGIDNRFDGIDNRFNGIDNRFNDVDNRFDGIDNRFNGIDNRFNDVDNRFDGIDNRFNGIDNRFNDVDNRFDGIDNRFNGIDNRFNDVDNRFDGIDNRFNGIDKRLNKNDINFNKLTEAVNELRKAFVKTDEQIGRNVVMQILSAENKNFDGKIKRIKIKNPYPEMFDSTELEIDGFCEKTPIIVEVTSLFSDEKKIDKFIKKKKIVEKMYEKEFRGFFVCRSTIFEDEDEEINKIIALLKENNTEFIDLSKNGQTISEVETDDYTYQ